MDSALRVEGAALADGALAKILSSALSIGWSPGVRREGPANTPSFARVHHGAVADLNLPRGVPGDVAAPQFVQPGAGKPAVDDVVAGGGDLGRPDTRGTWQAVGVGVVHQQPDQLFAEADSESLDKFSSRQTACTWEIRAVSHSRRIMVADIGCRRWAK